MDFPEAWIKAAAAIAASPALRILYVIGETSTGKTTLCRFLLSQLRRNFPAAYIDCDPGQSVIGPPGCVGLSLFPQPGQDRQVNYLRFVGATSPEDHQLQTAVGIKRLEDQALELGAQKVILDSSGFISGSSAHEFQVNLIDLLRPDALLSLEKGIAIERLLATFKRRRKLQVFRLPISPAAVEKTPVQRKSHRRDSFQGYFRASQERQVNLRGLGLHGQVPDLRKAERYRSLLVALCDSEQFVVSVGIILSVDLDKGTMRLFSPPFDPDRVCSLRFGSVYLSESGEEIRYAAAIAL